MITTWLKDEVELLFKASPFSRVILFFDPVRDYEKLIDHLSGDFKVLKYDGSLLKIKYEIDFSEQDKKYVVYLPFAENGKEISYLKEYLYTGKKFSHTLYAFLKKKGVKFPSEKEKIAEIKKSLPAIAFDSIGKDEKFWKNRFIKDELDIILPDFNQRLLDFIENPEETIEHLEDGDKLEAFQKLLEDEYGFTGDISNAELFRFNFIARVCFTELFIKTEKPSDFPFRDLLPREDKFENSINLLQNIRDSQRHKEVYKEITSSIEKKYSLKTFAKKHASNAEIETFKIIDIAAIEELANIDVKSKAEFKKAILSRKDFIEKKAKSFWAIEGEVPVSVQLKNICSLIESIEEFHQELPKIDKQSDLINRYCEKFYTIDQLYRSYLENKEDLLENLAPWIERLYVEFLDKINSKFTDFILEKGAWKLEDLDFQGNFFKGFEKKSEGKRAIIVVDALRFELGKELERRLSAEYLVEINPMYSQIPTITSVGMSFLFSIKDVAMDCDQANFKVKLKDGLDLGIKKNRVDYLKAKHKDLEVLTLSELNKKGSSEVKKIKDTLVVFSKELDDLGEAGGIDYLRFFSPIMQDIAKAVKKLLNSGFAEVHVVTDHGFLCFDDGDCKYKIAGEKPVDNLRRFACGEYFDEPNLIKLSIPHLKNKVLFFPRSIYYFKPDTFFHGGISIHETIIPHLIVKSRRDAPIKFDVELRIDKGISNRLFDVKLKPKVDKLDKISRTVEVLCLRGEEIISNKPAITVEAKEEQVRLRLLPSKRLSKGEKIKIIAQDQETREILDEIETETLLDFEEEEF
jgi:hypothetical protein